MDVEDVLVGHTYVGEHHMIADRLLGRGDIGSGGEQAQRKRDTRDEAADRSRVVRHVAARSAWLPRDEVGEEGAMVRLGVGVRVLWRIGSHEVDVRIEESVHGVLFRGGDGAHEDAGALQVERVVACAHTAMVVHVRDTPELTTALEDHVSDDLLGAALAAAAAAARRVQVHNGGGVLGGRILELRDPAERPAGRRSRAGPGDAVGETIGQTAP